MDSRKECSKCHRILWRTVEKFYRDATKVDGLTTRCKQCVLRSVKAAGSPMCKQCHVKHANKVGRLCHLCYKTWVEEEEVDEPTSEELDMIIAEQLKPANLPKWWPKDGIDEEE